MVACRPPVDPILQPPLLLFDQTAIELERQIRRLHYDDALLFGQWRIEYVKLLKGHPQYRVYHRGHLVGVVNVRAEDIEKCMRIRQVIAIYLAALGWSSDPLQIQFWRHGKITPLSASTYKLPDLIAEGHAKPKLEDTLPFWERWYSFWLKRKRAIPISSEPRLES